MSAYIPETKFVVTNNASLIYNLKQDGWHKGDPNIVNDVNISINARGLTDEQQEELARVVRDALNSAYFPEGYTQRDPC